jgi:hypothetical protein
VVQHQRLQFATHFAFGPAGPQPAAVHQVGQRGVGGLAGQPQQRHLAGVLDFAQRLHGLRGANQFGGTGLRRRRGQRVEAVHGDHMALEAQPPRAGRRGAPAQVAPASPLDGHLDVGRLLSGLGAVAAVGGQHRAVVVGEHQQRRVGPGETGQVAHVDQVCDQHRVQFGRAESRTERGSPLGMCHAS